MAHVRVAIYKFRPGTVDKVIEGATGKGGMAEIFKSQPGFIAYEIVKTGNDSGVSITTWETKEQANNAVHAAAVWVKNRFAPALVSAENHVGELAYSSRSH